jgi:hypothetical protein
MRRCSWLFLILIICVLLAGCTNPITLGKTTSTKSQGKTATSPTLDSSITPKFHFGDIIKENPDDTVGKMIMTYSPSSDSYTMRSIIYDEFGRLYYLGGTGEEGARRESVESAYTIQSGRIENPSVIPVMAKPYNPRNSPGDILIEFDYSPDGIIITRYDYSNDFYTYRLVRYTNGKWMYSSPESINEKRTVIEGKYPKTVTHIDPKSLQSA